MAVERPVVHIRLPERADAVGGQEQRPGESPAAEGAPDPRTVSQDPVLKTEIKSAGGVKHEN
jgi:hypothetical protein